MLKDMTFKEYYDLILGIKSEKLQADNEKRKVKKANEFETSSKQDCNEFETSSKRVPNISQDNISQEKPRETKRNQDKTDFASMLSSQIIHEWNRYIGSVPTSEELEDMTNLCDKYGRAAVMQGLETCGENLPLVDNKLGYITSVAKRVHGELFG